MKKLVPTIIVERLPIYLQALQNMQQNGQETTSSDELGRQVGISAAQIRKDLSQFGEFGKQGRGYGVAYLVEQLQAILQVDRVWDMALIGAGNLGRAIAHYPHFAQHGFRVALIFDNDPARIGQTMGNLVVQDIAQLDEQISQSRVQLAMLTVPAGAAQAVTDALVKAGIHAILNYAPITLVTPAGVRVQNVDPVIFLQSMTYFL